MGRAKRSTNINRQQRNKKTEAKTRRRYNQPCWSCSYLIDTKKHAYVLVPGRDYNHPIWYHYDCAPKEFKKDFYDE